MNDTPHTEPTPKFNCRCNRPRAFVSGVFALAVAAMLQFAALAKLMHPSADPKKQTDLFGLFNEPISVDYLIGSAEIVILLLVLVLHRWWLTWVGVTFLFSGFLGYVSWAAYIDKSCGCFGDLWQPEHWQSITIDASLVVAGLCLAAAYGLRFKKLLVVAALSVVCAGAGVFYGAQTLGMGKQAAADAIEATTPNEPIEQQPEQSPDDADTTDTTESSEIPSGEVSDDSAEARAARALLNLDINHDIRDAGLDQPATYIFIHSPDCHTCEEYKVFVDAAQAELESSQDPFMQVRQFNKYELRDDHGLPIVLWEPTPAVILVWGGAVAGAWNGEQAPYPGSPTSGDGVYHKLVMGEITPPAP